MPISAMPLRNPSAICAALVLGFAATATACNESNDKKPKSASAVPAGVQTPKVEAAKPAEPPAETQPADAVDIQIDQPLAELCGISEARVYFDYDSADLRHKGESRLDALANCLNESRLAGQHIEVIGHADPRGSTWYNDKLGMERARSVSELIVAENVARNRLKLKSAGESSASQNPNDWPRDRKVVIRLAAAAS